jgi:hypothetical protein
MSNAISPGWRPHALIRDTVDRLERTLPDDDPLIIELCQSPADIGEE